MKITKIFIGNVLCFYYYTLQEIREFCVRFDNSLYQS